MRHHVQKFSIHVRYIRNTVAGGGGGGGLGWGSSDSHQTVKIDTNPLFLI